MVILIPLSFKREAKMKKRIFRVTIILTLFVLSFHGCAGPKFMSKGYRFQQYWGEIPTQKDLSIKITSTPLIEKEQAELFTETLTKGLEGKKLFNKISIISPKEYVKTDIVLEVNIEKMVKTGWWARGGRYADSPCEVGVTGKLVDVKQDKTILTFSRERRGEGGLIGSGGCTRAGEDTMINSLLEWAAEDIVEIIGTKENKENK